MTPIQTLPVHITPLGILAAIVFAVVVAGTLYWMLKIQGSIRHGLTTTERALIEQNGPIVLGITPGVVLPTTIFLAATLAKQRKVPLLLLSVIELPYTLPPGAVMSKVQTAGEESLREARQVAKELGVEELETKLVSARAASQALISETEEFGASTLIIGAREKRREGIWFGSTATHILRNAKVEVIIDRVI
jgi:nucleotide-binding universal stress UspA family protein